MKDVLPAAQTQSLVPGRSIRAYTQRMSNQATAFQLMFTMLCTPGTLRLMGYPLFNGQWLVVAHVAMLLSEA